MTLARAGQAPAELHGVECESLVVEQRAMRLAAHEVSTVQLRLAQQPDIEIE